MLPKSVVPVVRRWIVLTVSVLMLTGMSLVASSSPASAGVDVVRSSFRGFSVDGSSSISTDGVTTFTRILADEESVLYVEYVFNTETGRFMSQASGRAVPTTFDAIGMRSTHVVATIHLLDAGGPVRTVEVDATWTASGKAARTRSNDTTTVPGVSRTIFRFSGRSAPATVTGNVPLTSGTIDDSTTTTIVIQYL